MPLLRTTHWRCYAIFKPRVGDYDVSGWTTHAAAVYERLRSSGGVCRCRGCSIVARCWQTSETLYHVPVTPLHIHYTHESSIYLYSIDKEWTVNISTVYTLEKLFIFLVYTKQGMFKHYRHTQGKYFLLSLFAQVKIDQNITHTVGSFWHIQ